MTLSARIGMTPRQRNVCIDQAMQIGRQPRHFAHAAEVRHVHLLGP